MLAHHDREDQQRRTQECADRPLSRVQNASARKTASVFSASRLPMIAACGSLVPDGCICITNEDVADRFGKVTIGTMIVVLPNPRRNLHAYATMPPRNNSVTLHRQLSMRCFVISVIRSNRSPDMRECSPTRVRSILAVATVVAVMSSGAPKAHALDLFTPLFDTLPARPAPPKASLPALGYNTLGDLEFPLQTVPPVPSGGRRSTAYCVRSCDGRYFPVMANNEQSRSAVCSSLCPASDTKIFHGSSIEHATSEGGKSYSSLPNAFKYRERLVEGCTCNGKGLVGLASISIGDDKTIRKGDVVAGEDGLLIATRGADKRRGKVADFSPAPQHIRARFERSKAMLLQ